MTLNQYEAKMRDLNAVNEELRAEVDRYVSDLAAVQEKLRNEETLRRTLHNTIQELKVS